MKAISILITILLLSNCKIKESPRFFGIIPVKDDNKYIVYGNTGSLFTNEFGKSTSFSIRLSATPKSDVTIGPIKSLNSEEGVVTSDSFITFTSSNFDVDQYVTIQGVGDGIADGNKTFEISLGTVQTSDYSYSLIKPQNISVTNTDKETASIASITSAGLVTSESGTSTTISVVLSTMPGADVVIPGFSSDNPTECSVSGSLTFNSSNWDIPQQITVTGVDDFIIDGAQTCNISSSPSTSNDKVYENKTMPVISVTNVDNDSAGFTFIPITSAVTSESGGQARVSIVMNTIPVGTVSISGITTSDSTEASVSPANVSFDSSNWNTPQVLTITGIDDNMQDGDINFTLVTPNSVATNPADSLYNGLSPSSAGSFTNLDNDIRGVNIVPLAPTTSILPLTLTEGGSSQTFQVRLSSVPCSTPSTPSSCTPGSVTVNFTNNNTSKYSISPSSLTFGPSDWNTYQTVTVTPIDNFIDDGDVDLTLLVDSISSTTDYNGFDPSDIPIRVINNDIAGFTITPSGGITVNENDPGGVGLESTFTVVLNSQPTGNVTLGPILSSDTLEAVIAPTLGGGNTPISNRTLVFTPTKDQAITNSDSNSDTINDTTTGGWNVPQTIRVRAVVDGTLDGTQVRSITFGTRTTTDSKYSNSSITPISSLPVTNIDSGTPSITLQAISATSFPEDNSSTITFQVVLNTLPTAAVNITNIITSDTSEGVILPNGGGASITNRSLVFTTTTNQVVTGTNTTTGGWNMPQTITVRSVADNFDDGDITFKVTFPGALGATEYVSLKPISSNSAYNNSTGELSLINTDNDTRGVVITANSITSPSTPLTVTEGGGNSTFNVRLSSDPCNSPSTPSSCASGAVTINLTNNNTSQYTISPSSLTFSTGTWNSNQTVTVSPVNDSFDENNMDFTLSLDSISSTGTDYDGLNPSDVYVRVQDNDTKNINLTLVTGYSHVVSSSGGYTEYNLSLASRPAVGNTVTVTASVPTGSPQEGKILAADNSTGLDSRDFIFDSTNWSAVQTFRVKGQTGSGAGTATFDLSLSAAETGTLPPAGHTALTYNNYNGVNRTQTITNYHIGSGKKIRIAGATTTLTETAQTPTFFWILLNQAPVADVTINFGIDSSFPCTLPSAVGSTTQFTVDTSFLVLTSSNWNQITDSNRIQITSVNDLVDDGDVACPIRITSINTTDPYYSGLSSSDYNEPSITVTDDDAYGIEKQNVTPLVSSRLVTSQSGAGGSVQYRLSSKPMSNVVISFGASPSRAAYSPSTLTFTPSNYSSWQTVNITGLTSGLTADENYTITATASSGESSTGFGNSGIYNTLTNVQNATNIYNLYDLVPCASSSIVSCSSVNSNGGTVSGIYTTTESGGQTFFAIKLRAKPSSNVTIPFSSSNTGEGTLSTSSLVFTTANWDTLQAVTVTGVDDVIIDGNISYNINFTAMTGDSSFTTVIPSLNISNTDNDTAGVVLTNVADLGVPETNYGGSFTVKLRSQPTADVQIPLTVSAATLPDTGLTITSSSTLTFTSGNWNVPQTVTFTWTDDGTNTPATRVHYVRLGTTTSTDPNFVFDPSDYGISINNL